MLSLQAYVEMIMLDESTKVFIGKMIPQLDEKQRRIFLGGLSEMLGRGSVKELHELTKVSQVTIIEGKKECEKITPSPEVRSGRTAGNVRIRAEGAGRKTATEKYPQVIDELKLLVQDHTVGNSEDPLCWTTKSLRNLEAALKEKNISISHVTIGGLLVGMGYSLQQNKKFTESGDPGPDRDAQFRFINDKAKEFMRAMCPVISVDAKKKELIGRYKNNGSEWAVSGQPIKVKDHDFEGPGGKACPYGIYDLNFNEGFVNVGISADTAEFAVNSIREWWKTMGSERYPGADRLYITADGGGSNGRRNKLWKTSLQQFANETGLSIHVSHFPPGTSKWNKIEHRLFAFISKNWRGRPLETLEIIVNLIGSTTTSTGLKVKCKPDMNTYEKGKVVTDEELENLNFTANAWHEEWNYVIAPNSPKY